MPEREPIVDSREKGVYRVTIENIRTGESREILTRTYGVGDLMDTQVRIEKIDSGSGQSDMARIITLNRAGRALAEEIVPLNEIRLKVRRDI